MNKVTESILCAKEIPLKNGKTKVLVMASSGAEIWLNKEQYKDSASRITFIIRKAGDEVVATRDGQTKSGIVFKAGDKIKLESPTNEFVGLGSPSMEEKLAALVKAGINPSINL